MSSDKAQLLAMGFEAGRIDWALRATKNSGLHPAMDHLFANSDKPVPDPSTQTLPSGSVENVDEDDENAAATHIKKMGTASEADLVPRSIKCSECGKTFRSQATATFHAEKSGHQAFEESAEEIKPLTEEEKKAKLQDLREKLAARRAAQNQDEVKANKANESLRRKAGQDTGKIKEDMQLKEAQKDADRKKKEKLDDQKARAAIKAQIDADKRERAEKVAREKALRDGESSAPISSVTNITPVRPAVAIKSSEAPETRLQVRLSVGGQPITKTFASESTLVDVAEWVASENLAYDVATVTFASTFPRKTFSKVDMGRTLKENGLTPSAVLMAS